MNLRTNVYTAPPRLSASTRPGLLRRRRRELPHLDPPIHRTAQEVLEVERVVALRRLESVIHAFRVVVHQQVQDLTRLERLVRAHDHFESVLGRHRPHVQDQDRKSTRLNSSHVKISYAVFCLKKKKTDERH